MKSFTYRVLLAVLLVVLVNSLGSGSTYPRVLTKRGIVRGIRQVLRCEKGYTKTIYKFLGIPYAQAPIDDLRFKRPKPLPMNRSSTEYNATYYRPICAQFIANINKLKGAWPDFDKEKDIKEDCLFLNIYTPFINGSYKYPVIVFIHGGRFLAGTPIFDDTPAEYLPTRGVVLVTFQYRLGPFGFLATGESEAPGNMGLLDQVEALKWVQQNIEEFGGDKNSVTLLGESAGGSSVGLHYLSPLSKNLFHRGIAVSGADVQVGPIIMKSWSVVEGASNRLIEKVKCDNFQCLQSYDKGWKSLLNNLYGKEYDINLMSPVVDNHFLLESPRKLRRDGNFAKLPLMAGFTSREGSQLVDFLKGLMALHGKAERADFEVDSLEIFQSAIRASLELNLGVQNAKQRNQYTQVITTRYVPWRRQGYPGYRYAKALEEIHADMAIVAPIHAALTFHTDHNASAYMFEFAYPPSGAEHGDTQSYEFGKPLLKPKDYSYADRNVSEIMVTMFTNFAKFGNPTPSPVRGVQWQTFSSSNKAYLRIQEKPVMASKYHESKINFWNDNFAPWFMRNEN